MVERQSLAVSRMADSAYSSVKRQAHGDAFARQAEPAQRIRQGIQTADKLCLRQQFQQDRQTGQHAHQPPQLQQSVQQTFTRGRSNAQVPSITPRPVSYRHRSTTGRTISSACAAADSATAPPQPQRQGEQNAHQHQQSQRLQTLRQQGKQHPDEYLHSRMWNEFHIVQMKTAAVQAAVRLVQASYSNCCIKVCALSRCCASPSRNTSSRISRAPATSPISW